MLTPEAHNEFKADVLKRYPEEACGLVIAGKYYTCINALPDTDASDPAVKPREGAFRISKEERLALTLAHGQPQCVLHSHPYGLYDSKVFIKEHRKPQWPSVPDQTAFIADTCDWGIVATDGIGISEFCWLTNDVIPIETRPFEWFASDCYTIVRDWHKLHGVGELPNFPRMFEFWKQPVNSPEANSIELAIKGIQNAQCVAREKAEVGDIAVFAMGSPKVNHLGVITGPDEMLHHPAHRYPETVRWSEWLHKAKYVVRVAK
jgi:cell wall-associated NlpC family hydrolase